MRVLTAISIIIQSVAIAGIIVWADKRWPGVVTLFVIGCVVAVGVYAAWQMAGVALGEVTP